LPADVKEAEGPAEPQPEDRKEIHGWRKDGGVVQAGAGRGGAGSDGMPCRAVLDKSLAAKTGGESDIYLMNKI